MAERMMAERVSLREQAVARRVRDVRIARGMSQRALADRVGVLRESWCRVEKGHRRLHVGELIDAAEALDVSVAELVAGRPLVLEVRVP